MMIKRIKNTVEDFTIFHPHLTMLIQVGVSTLIGMPTIIALINVIECLTK